MGAVISPRQDKPDTKKLAAISRFFSSGVILEMARRGRSALFTRLATESDLVSSVPHYEPVSSVFEAAFSSISRLGNRDEYIYRAALTQKVLLGIHNLATASMLSEFRVGNCKADVVILNGTATVYEIKSERDSLMRLERQIAAYREVFARVYVISSDGHVDSIMNIVPNDVGILTLNTRHQISPIREATDRAERASPAAIFEAVRTEEARLILELHGIKFPEVPNTMLRSTLRQAFLQLDARQAHGGMVDVLKRTRNLSPLSALVSQLPRCLQPAALSIPLRKLDHARLLLAINTSFRDAMEWA